MKQRFAIVLFAIAVAVAALGSTPIGPAAAFAKPAAGTAEPFVPFVTDFPKPAARPAPSASASGIDWVDVGIGGGIGAALAALLAGSALAVTCRARTAEG